MLSTAPLLRERGQNATRKQTEAVENTGSEQGSSQCLDPRGTGTCPGVVGLGPLGHVPPQASFQATEEHLKKLHDLKKPI